MIPKKATIVAYDVILDASVGKLALRINDHIRNGWQPLGKLHIHPKTFAYFAQVIVRYDTTPCQSTNA